MIPTDQAGRDVLQACHQHKWLTVNTGQQSRNAKCERTWYVLSDVHYSLFGGDVTKHYLVGSVGYSIHML